MNTNCSRHVDFQRSRKAGEDSVQVPLRLNDAPERECKFFPKREQGPIVENFFPEISVPYDSFTSPDTVYRATLQGDLARGTGDSGDT